VYYLFDKLSMASVMENGTFHKFSLSSKVDREYTIFYLFGVFSDDVTVGCITVSLLPIRTEMELQNRRYWDALATSLQSSVLLRVNSVSKFIDESTENLNAPRHSMDHVAEAYKNHARITSTSADVLKNLEECIKMNKTLASWTKEKIEVVAEVAAKWDLFQGQLQNFENIIGRQVRIFYLNMLWTIDR